MAVYYPKKTFYFNFFPTKSEELQAVERVSRSSGDKHTSRVLVEINDLMDYKPPPQIINDPRRITKTVSVREVANGMLFLSFVDTFEHIFRYWGMEEVNYVLNGHNKLCVSVWDVTDFNQTPPKVYSSDPGIYFQRGHGDEHYVLGCMDIIRDRGIQYGDEVGIGFERDSRNGLGMFLFKLLNRRNRPIMLA